MAFNIATYNPRETPVHCIDARVKIVLVFVFSITLFCVHTWWAQGVLALCVFTVAGLARLNLRSSLKTFLPLFFIFIVTLLSNSFVLDVRSYDALSLPGSVSPGIFEGLSPIALVGAFGFSAAGFARGCYYVVRIILLLGASLILTTTTSSTEITQALRFFLRPATKLGVPTHDIATVVSIALRFIPVSIEEFQQLRMSQSARGASFDTGGLFSRLRVWVSVLVPLFVGLYRRADTLALAMDARCYGSAQASELSTMQLSFAQGVFLVFGIAVCLLLAFAG